VNNRLCSVQKKNNARYLNVPVPVAARSKTLVCGRSPAGIAGSNPTGAWMFVCLVIGVCVVR